MLGIGDNTVDIYVDRGAQFPGGNAVNVAVLTRRLGADSAYLGTVGDDPLGCMIRDALVSEGVDVGHLRIGEAPSCWSRILHDGADRVFGDSRPTPPDAIVLSQGDLDWIAGFDLAHSSVYSKTEDDLPRIRGAGPILSFDYSAEYDDAYVARTAPHVDIAFLSAIHGEAEACEALARSAAAHGPSLVVVTRGAQGALALEGGVIVTSPAAPAEVVDTLGAGDGFIAGLLMARLDGAPLARQLDRGAQEAAKVCGVEGAFGHKAPIRPGQPGLSHPAASPGRGRPCIDRRGDRG